MTEAGVHSLSGGAECDLRVGIKGMKGGRQSADQSGGDCRAQGKKQSGGAKSDDCFRGKGLRRDRGNYCIQSEIREEATKSAAGNRQRETFNQQLANQAETACAQSGSDAKFFFSRCGASEEEICDVTTRD